MSARNILAAVTIVLPLQYVMDKQEQKWDDSPPAIEKPKSGHHYWVQCQGYKCLGKVDESGNWFSVGTGKELTDVVRAYQNP
jgi:hypothetical protein